MINVKTAPFRSSLDVLRNDNWTMPLMLKERKRQFRSYLEMEMEISRRRQRSLGRQKPQVAVPGLIHQFSD